MTLDHPCASCTNGLHVQCTGVCGCLADHPSDDDTMRGFKRLKRQMHPEREAWVRGWLEPTASTSDQSTGARRQTNRGEVMGRLWHNQEGTREGKYLVLRRDGTVPQWPFFVIGGADPAASHALDAYADAAEEAGMDPDYVADIRALSNEFDAWHRDHANGDPDAPRHREDNPRVLRMMSEGVRKPPVGYQHGAEE